MANAPVVTKRKDGDGKFGPRYRILINGQPTAFCVEKSIPPKYRCPQMWDVIEGEDPEAVLFDSSGLDRALGTIQAIAEATAKAVQS
jgi:hypothetical protein